MNKKKNEFVEYILALVIITIFSMFLFTDIFKGEKSFLVDGDSVLQTFSWISKVANAVRNGELALWDFNQYSGTSFAGEIQTAPFYVPNIIFVLVCGKITQFKIDIYIVIHFIAGAMFMFAFLRHNTKSFIPAVCSGCFFVYVGSVFARAPGQPNIFMGLIWIPLVMLLYQMSVEIIGWTSKKIAFVFATGIVLANMILAGHMQPYIHCVIALIIFDLCISLRTGQLINNTICLMGVGISSIAFSFGQIMSGFEYLKASYRWVGLEKPVSGMEKLPIEAYMDVVISWDKIRGVIDNTISAGDGCYFYTSIVGLLIVMVGIIIRIISREASRTYLFAVILMIFSFIAAFGEKSFLGRILIRLPITNSVREPARILYLFSFAFCVLLCFSVVDIIDLLKKYNKATSYLIYGLVIFLSVWESKSFVDSQLHDCVPGKTASDVYYHSSLIDMLEKEAKEDKLNGLCYRYACNSIEDTLTPNLANRYSSLFGLFGHRATMRVSYYDFICEMGWDYTGTLGDQLAVKYYISNDKVETIDSRWKYYGEICEKHVYINENAYSMFRQVSKDGKYSDFVYDNITWKCNSVRIKGTADDDYVQFQQMYYPGWKVKINGKRASLETDEYGFIRIPVIQDEVLDILFFYDPWWMKTWVVVFIGCCLIFLFFIMYCDKLHVDFTRVKKEG